MLKLNRKQKKYLKCIESKPIRQKMKSSFKKQNQIKEFEDAIKLFRKLFKNQKSCEKKST
jgi:transposase-like protein